MRKIIPLIVLSLAAACIAADAPPAADQAPRTPAVIDAKRVYDAAAKEARAVYSKAMIDADQTYIAALGKAEDGVLAQGLSAKPEADRIDAVRLAAIDAMKGHKAATATAAASNVPGLAGSMWKWNGQDAFALTYNADGTISADSWHGQRGRWQVVDDHSIRQFQPQSPDTLCITFAADMQHALWVNEKTGDVAYSVRAH